MKQRELHYFVGYMSLGLFFGFFGSLVSYAEVLFAPIAGMLFFSALKHVKGVSHRLVIVATILGIFLGGLPTWGLVVASFFESYWFKLASIAIIPVLFLLGIGLAIIIDRIRLWVNKEE